MPHGYPALVFDSQYRLDLLLTSFIKQAQRRLSPRSVRIYVYALLPFLGFVERTPAAPNKQPGWNTTPERVRVLAARYLEEELGCVIRQHRLGFELVSRTARSPSNARTCGLRSQCSPVFGRGIDTKASTSGSNGGWMRPVPSSRMR